MRLGRAADGAHELQKKRGLRAGGIRDLEPVKLCVRFSRIGGGGPKPGTWGSRQTLNSRGPLWRDKNGKGPFRRTVERLLGKKATNRAAAENWNADGRPTTQTIHEKEQGGKKGVKGLKNGGDRVVNANSAEGEPKQGKQKKRLRNMSKGYDVLSISGADISTSQGLLICTCSQSALLQMIQGRAPNARISMPGPQGWNKGPERQGKRIVSDRKEIIKPRHALRTGRCTTLIRHHPQQREREGRFTRTEKVYLTRKKNQSSTQRKRLSASAGAPTKIQIEHFPRDAREKKNASRPRGAARGRGGKELRRFLLLRKNVGERKQTLKGTSAGGGEKRPKERKGPNAHSGRGVKVSRELNLKGLLKEWSMTRWLAYKQAERR